MRTASGPQLPWTERGRRCRPHPHRGCAAWRYPRAARSEHHGPPLRFGLLPGVGDAVNLQPSRVEQAQQTALVAQLHRGLELDSNSLARQQCNRVQWHPLLESVQQCPAVEVEVVRAGVEQGDGLALRCGTDGVDQGCDDPHEVIRLRRARDGVAGLIVGVPALALERQKDGYPLVRTRIVQQQPAVLSDAVVVAEPAGVALVHVDVVYAVSRGKAEDLVRLTRLRSPPLTERIQAGGWVRSRPAHVVLELVGQVVVRPGRGRR